MLMITVDTNVWYQALRSSKSASFYILQLVRQQKLQLALSVPTFAEYEDVLSRPASLSDLVRTPTDIQTFLRFIAQIGHKFDIHYLFRPNLSDENDNIFVELSLTSNSRYLITNNIRDFTRQTELKFDDLQVITPTDFVREWRRQHE